MEEKKIIEFGNIVKSFDGQVILKGINLDIYENEFVTLLGPSGCGKSTLLDLICHLLTPESGTITLKSATGGKDEAKIGYMLQKDHLLEWRSVYQNVILG